MYNIGAGICRIFETLMRSPYFLLKESNEIASLSPSSCSSIFDRNLRSSSLRKGHSEMIWHNQGAYNVEPIDKSEIYHAYGDDVKIVKDDEPKRTRISKIIILTILLLLLLGVMLFLGAIIGYLLRKCSGDGSSERALFVDSKSNLPIEASEGKHAVANHATTTVEPTMAPSGILRLTTHFVPTHYYLEFHLVDTELLRGRVSIVMLCTKDTDSVTFHAHRDLHIPGSILITDSQDGSNVPWRTLSPNKEASQIQLYTYKNFVAGRTYNLTISYMRKLCSPHSSGSVTCSVNDNQHQFATKLEPMRARELFPCFDEPHFKATFNITVVYKKSDYPNVLSNEVIRVSRETDGDGYTRDDFHQTKPMSSYLVAIAAGHFRSVCMDTATAIPICIWADADRFSEMFQWSINPLLWTAVDGFDTVQKYFVVPYPLSKLDFVFISNYATRAMENWGLVVMDAQFLDAAWLRKHTSTLEAAIATSKEADEQIDADLNSTMPTLSTTTKVAVMQQTPVGTAKTILHEIAHQWFGNLVTMQWWDDIFLNEGFATYFGYYFISELYPETVENTLRERKVHFIRKQAELRVPLVREFASEAEFTFLGFDTVNLYIKGSLIVEMLSNLMGPEQLRLALSEYLKDNAYGNTNRSILWRYLENKLGQATSSGQYFSIAAVMEPWTTNPGFPEIRFLRNYETGEITLTQSPAIAENHQFLPSLAIADQRTSTFETFTDSKSLVWPIPIVYDQQREDSSGVQLDADLTPPVVDIWLYNKTLTFTDLGVRSEDWIIANSKMLYPVRIDYDDENWRMLIFQLKENSSEIPVASRLQLLEDAEYFLKHSDRLPIYLELLSYLANETYPLAFNLGIEKLVDVFLMLRATAAFPSLQSYYRPLGDSLSDRLRSARNLGPQTVDHICKLLCATKHRLCNSAAKLVARQLEDNRHKESGPCEAIFLCHYLRHNVDIEESTRLLQLNRTFDSQYSRNKLRFCPVNSTLAALVVDSIIRSKDEAYVREMFLAIMNPLLLENNPFPAREFWSAAADAIATNSTAAHFLSAYFNAISGQRSFFVNAINSQYEMFHAKRSLSSKLLPALEIVQKRIQWTEEIDPLITQWLQEQAAND